MALGFNSHRSKCMPVAGAPDPGRGHAKGSSAAAAVTPPRGSPVSPVRRLGQLSSSRAAHALPKAQPEDFASPLQSGLRFGVMSQVSPDVGSAFGRSSATDQVIARIQPVFS